MSAGHHLDPERHRQEEARLQKKPWRRWGPYVSDRQWGTVREDYSPNGDAWDYFPHDHARSRAYRWGEDGIAGVCDEEQRLCLAVAFWNGKDPILKERFFGLTNEEGNHGEDVKELYWYLDATPTASYLKMLYKYPQRAFPYDQLKEENHRRGRDEPEYELLDTGIFDEDRYFDIFVEYAKAGPDDLLLKITAHNRGPEAAELHVLPTLWFRNTWTWKGGATKPQISVRDQGVLEAKHPDLGTYFLIAENDPPLLFCDNETNVRRMYDDQKVHGHFKDAFHDYLIHGDHAAVNPSQLGTKAAAHYSLTVPAGGSAAIRVRMTMEDTREAFADFEATFSRRQKEADAFFHHLQVNQDDAEKRLIQRHALAGMVWCQQFFYYDIPEWLNGDPGQPPPPAERKHGRNIDWKHLNNAEILSVPDKWEYPWYAAWDLAFHCLPLALIDSEFAKQQLILLTREWYMHPNGQLPAYEWAFGDGNPPVHAWAAWRVYQIDRNHRGGHGDLAFLERVFHKLMLNFTWWVNRRDASGRNVFQGGFLGMDNVGIFDRNERLPGGGYLNQSDGTSWMAMYCLNLMRIALELALHNKVYEDIATKFFEHFLYIAQAMTNIGGDEKGVGLWDDDDQFYYDELILPDGTMKRLKIRSMVGLIPLFAVETLEPEMLQRLPDFNRRLEWFLNYRPDLASLVSRWHEAGRGDRRLLSLLRGHRMKRLLNRMLDETEFLSEFGVRSVSRYYKDHPYYLQCDGHKMRLQYVAGESDSGLFGGNSNWRGPIWFPVNYLIIESLQKFHHYYGDDFKIEYPVGSGQMITILQASQELTRRLTRLFLKDEHGQRPVFGNNPKLQNDPHFKDYPLFFEYFDGDTGRGLGANHQTGWTGLIAKLLQPRREDHHEHLPAKDGAAGQAAALVS